MALTDAFLISTDHAETGIFTCSTRIRLESHACKTSDDLELVRQVFDECLITLCLIFRYEWVNVHETCVAEWSHFLSSIELHGTRTEGNHRVGEGDILAFEALDVAHHFGFSMILVEHFVSEERAGTSQFSISEQSFRNILHIEERFFGSDAEDMEKYVQLLDISSFVDADTYLTIFIIAEVHFLTQGNGAELLLRYVFRQFEAECIEEPFVGLLVTQLGECIVQIYRDAMDALSNGLDTFLTMICCIETCHSSEECLSRTDVRCSLFALDVLFASLECHTIAKLAILVLRKTDDTTRHVALELVACSEVCSRRTTIEHWDTETLSATEYDVCTPFAWRNEHSEREDVCIYSHLCTCCMSLFHECTIVFYATV